MKRLLRKCRRGTAAVEFALVVPVLATMILGMCEVGRALNATVGTVERMARHVLLTQPLEQSVHDSGCLTLKLRGQMRVEPRRDGGAAVAENLANSVHGHTLSE